MKIHEFKVKPYSIPFLMPFKTASHTYTHRKGLWINIKYENYSGWGEAAPLIGFSNETMQEVYYALEGFHQAIDREIMDEEELLLLSQIHTKGIPSAQFALEMAIYDLFAKRNAKPLAKYLNSKAKLKLAVNGIVGIHKPEEGYKVMKCKVGYRNLFDEIKNMEKLTKIFGEDIKFRLDANGIFDLPKAIRFCKEMEKFNIDYIEQPLPANELIDLSELTYHTSIPIALDESLTDLNSAINILEQQSGHVFIIKPMISGGFNEANKIIQLAIDENIRAVVTSSIETAVGRLANAHIAVINNIKEHCGLATAKLLNDNIDIPNIKNGIIKLNEDPGIGIEL